MYKLMTNYLASPSNMAVSKGDLYAVLDAYTSSTTFETNHGPFAILVDQDRNDSDYNGFYIYHSFLKLQGQ